MSSSSSPRPGVDVDPPAPDAEAHGSGPDAPAPGSAPDERGPGHASDAEEPGSTSVADTAVRRRTRRAIIDAAVHAWARDFAAPLSLIAQEAAVSRSTLHRYFPDRPALLDACLRTALEVFGELAPCDDLPGGTLEQPALDQLVSQLESTMRLGDWVLFLWTDPTRFAGHPLAEDLVGGEDDVTLALVRRGQAEGSLDPDAPADWLLGIYYSVLYCAADLVVRGVMPASDAGRLASRALRHGVTPPA